jgi:hypothetical protein
MGVAYREAFNAARVVEREASPQLPITARAVAQAIPQMIPVHHGVAKRLTKIDVEFERDVGGGRPSAHVLVRSPFWHFLEYGTRFNPPYRPIQRAVESLRLRFIAR